MNNNSFDSSKIDYTNLIAVDLNNGRLNFVAQDIHGTSLSGDTISVPLNKKDYFYLLAFFDYGCNGCEAVWSESSSRFGEINNGELIVILKDLPQLQKSEDLSAGSVTVVCSSQAWNDFKISNKSYVVVIHNRLVVTESSVLNFDHLLALEARATTKISQRQL